MDENDRRALEEACAQESAELLEVLEQGLLALEEEPSDRETLGALFRAAHTLKGTAVVVGFTQVAALAHAVEDVLERLAGGSLFCSDEVLVLLFAGLDGLRQGVAAALEGHDAPSPLLARFEAFLQGSRGEPTGDARGEGHATESGASLGARAHRVSGARLDRALELMSELSVAFTQVGAALGGEAQGLEAVRSAHADAEQLALRLQEELLSLRMVPVGALFRPHGRTVRDLSRAKGKNARLVVLGAEVELDASVAEAARDPLLHLVRNAVDHGLETPEVRAAAGKPPVGTITLRSWHEYGRVFLSVSDDGAGFDRPRLLAQGRALGLIGAHEVPPDAALDALVFSPGFSTAAQVDEISGRGVGLDVVKRNVEALRGSVRVESRRGEGTTFVLALPLTLAIIEGFAVELGDQTYVLPVDAVEECVAFAPQAAGDGRQQGVVNLRGQALPWLRPHARLKVRPQATGRESLVVVRCSAGRAGLVVDRLVGSGQAVIKPLPRGVTTAPGLSGSSLLPDGRVALIVDVEGLLSPELRPAPSSPSPASQEQT